MKLKRINVDAAFELCKDYMLSDADTSLPILIKEDAPELCRLAACCQAIMCAKNIYRLAYPMGDYAFLDSEGNYIGNKKGCPAEVNAQGAMLEYVRRGWIPKRFDEWGSFAQSLMQNDVDNKFSERTNIDL